MITNFSEQLWIDFDLEVAIFLENLVSWIRFNASKDNPEQRNFHEGRYWSYNSYPQLAKLFSGWTSKTMRTIITRCIKHELILVGNFNKKKYDNTNWYTLSDKALAYFPIAAEKLYPDSSVDSDIGGLDLYTAAQTGRTPAQTGRPIPEDLNSLRNNTTNSSNSDYSSNQSENNSEVVQPTDKPDKSAKSDYCDTQTEDKSVLLKNKQKGKGGTAELRQYIDVYRDEFPDNPQPHPKVISTSLQKTLQTLIKKWPELDPNGNPLNPETFRRYLQQLRICAPKFSLSEYETVSGHRKKNSLETFARWNTVVKFLENQYS